MDQLRAAELLARNALLLRTRPPIHEALALGTFEGFHGALFVADLAV